MVVAVVAVGVVERVGVGDEGFSACLFDSAHYFVNKEWLDIVGVPEFAYMQFDGDEVVFLYGVKCACFIVEPVGFLQQVTSWIPWNQMNSHKRCLLPDYQIKNSI